MKVLVIPSWYPYHAKPTAGKFFYEQALALAENGIADITILNWGQNEFQLQIRHPVQSMGRLIKLCTAKAGSKQITPSFKELLIPHLSFSSHIRKGNIDALVNMIALQDKPDLIHAHVSFPAGYLAWKLSDISGIPFIITEHSGPFPFLEFVNKRGISPLISQPLQAANKVLAVSSFLKKELMYKANVKADIVPNLVDTEYYKPTITPKNKSFRLFALSSLTEAKGALDLLEAVKLLNETGLDFCMYWGGDGYLKSRLHNFVQQYKLKSKVVFLGQLSSKEALHQYQSCDCFVMPSHVESFSVVLIEALACGKPVISTDCGGPSDIVNKWNGTLVPIRSPRLLAEAMMHMSQHSNEYSQEHIRTYCQEHYSPKVVCRQIKDAYNSVLNPEL
ncbi:MAG: phosphatidylinositol N-acetylglucosaminyltransferase [Candidatus Cloacimonetes bacterium HGW-Cloacimonetes-3]|nr:MAG: phosphatidylinositol N-acetylglucosaminyltransferase [Candidatus Cloacimonetes bacterium HGW-Cloacimonetes-3]